MNINIGFWTCGVLVIPFFIVGVFFAILKEKAVKFVSGFNTLPKQEQALYDKPRLARDMRNQCFVWSAIMLGGAVLSYFFTDVYKRQGGTPLFNIPVRNEMC